MPCPWTDPTMVPQYEPDPEYPMYDDLETIDIEPAMTVQEYEHFAVNRTN